jgi:DNA replication protein DnaC
MLGGVTLGELARAARNPEHEFREMIETECSQGCGARFKVMRYFAPITACDDCRAKAIERHRIEDARAYWEEICPINYRKTDIKHPDFPKAQHEATQGFCGNESLLFFGPSRSGKTRLAIVLAKRCLIHFNKRVGILWEEDIEHAKVSYDRRELVKKWGRYDLLVMDDALLASAKDDRTTSFLKNLIDYRMRYERHSIITSQIGSEDYEESGEKKDGIKKQDQERIKALLARIKESFRVISFAPVTPKQGEEAF